MTIARSWGMSDLGKRRPRNEDSYVADETTGIFAVCDGMGGHQAGDVASAVTCDVIEKLIKSREASIDLVRGGQLPPELLADIVGFAVAEASATVYRLSLSKSQYQGMGTTVTLMLVAGEFAAIAHVGDSRLYRVRNGQIEQLTADHTFVAELIKSGLVEPKNSANLPFSSNLTRAVGNEDRVDVDTSLITLVDGDRYLIASDGLTNSFSSAEDLLTYMSGERELTCSNLVKFANETDGSDNITAIIVDIVSELDGLINTYSAEYTWFPESKYVDGWSSSSAMG
jgi:serine/threonine protein phosphatase PrpC